MHACIKGSELNFPDWQIIPFGPIQAEKYA